MHVHASVCLWVWICRCMRMCMCVCMCVRLYDWLCICLCVCMSRQTTIHQIHDYVEVHGSNHILTWLVINSPDQALAVQYAIETGLHPYCYSNMQSSTNRAFNCVALHLGLQGCIHSSTPVHIIWMCVWCRHEWHALQYIAQLCRHIHRIAMCCIVLCVHVHIFTH